MLKHCTVRLLLSLVLVLLMCMCKCVPCGCRHQQKPGAVDPEELKLQGWWASWSGCQGTELGSSGEQCVLCNYWATVLGSSNAFAPEVRHQLHCVSWVKNLGTFSVCLILMKTCFICVKYFLLEVYKHLLRTGLSTWCYLFSRTNY